MTRNLPHTINVRGQLLPLDKPQVMGILNVTPDSFYAESRMCGEESIRERIRQIREEGGDFLDIGGYSSRPGADHISAKEELARLSLGLKIAREEWPDAIISVDTFRADVARACVEEHGADIINDISGGTLDERMFRTVADLHVPYILMHMKGTPQDMQTAPHYDDVTAEVMQFFAHRVAALHEMGACDIILDPGFGFAKTLDHNYELLHHVEALHALQLPILVGVSRKSMVYRLLDTTPQEALNGTSVLHTIALTKGASILRVHDVRACREVIAITEKTLNA